MPSIAALYRAVYEQSFDAPFAEQVELCAVLGELSRLRDIEAVRGEGKRADVEALAPALVDRARALGVEIDEQQRESAEG